MDSAKEQIFNAFNKDIKKFDFCQIDQKRDYFNSLLPFSEEEKLAQKNYFEDWLIRFVYNSNSIEGSTLSLGDTALVCEGEYIPTDKNSKLKDIFAAKGICDGYKFMQNQVEQQTKLNKKLIQDIHEITCLDMDVSVRGIFRSSPVFIKGANTVPVPPEKVKENIEDLIFAYKNSQTHTIIKAAAFHCMYERIHPFQDGNGRSGRTLLNFILEKQGYPSITIKNDAKGQYYKALDKWAFDGENQLFINLVRDSIENELDNKINIIEQSRKINQKKTKNKQYADIKRDAVKDSAVLGSKDTKRTAPTL